jgi:hypothetical protein
MVYAERIRNRANETKEDEEMKYEIEFNAKENPAHYYCAR